MSDADVEKARSGKEVIKVRGKNCPKPIQSWVQAGVSLKMMNALKK